MAYLSVAQYIARYGERETILLTNNAVEVPGVPAVYDSAKVQTAIDDAIQTVDGFVGIVYVTPIADPPRIVQGFVAALAREALFVNVGKISEAAEKAADLARSQLKDVAKGTMKLPIAVGQTAPTQATGGEAQVSNDRPSESFTSTAIDSFIDGISPGGSAGGAWRYR